MMKRFYIKRVSDFVTIVHRPTHQIIMMGEMNEEMGKQIKRFINMTTEEFYKELNSLGLKFKTSRGIQGEQDKEKEDWYEKAWLCTTKQVLKHYKINPDSIPEEEVPLELIKELQKREETSWNIEPKEERKEAIEEEKKSNKRTLNKRKKLPKKIKNDKVKTLNPYKTKQEIRSAYIAGEIDISTFKKYMKALKKLEMV